MNGWRILVVDDSLTIRRALELILKPLGYELDFAADGAQALARAIAFAPDLVMLDYVLPDMRAPDVCAALAANPTTASTPIILVSAKGASIRQAYQDAQNVVSYITKPFKPQVVTSVVQNALARLRSGAGVASDAAATPRPQAYAHDVQEARRPGDAESVTISAAPASIEHAFAVLLAQLEGAMCGEAGQYRSGAGRNGTLFSGVSPRLRQATAHLDDISRHLHGDSVVPYRLREDGSFANVAATLLAAHRALCEAAILLAAAGAPSAVLPLSPDVLVVCPVDNPVAAEISTAVRGRDLVPLAIGGDFAQVPHLVRLLAPRAVVGVRCGHADADAAVARSLALGVPDVSFIDFTTPGVDAGELDARCSRRVDGIDPLIAALSDLVCDARRAEDQPPDIDLEVVAI